MGSRLTIAFVSVAALLGLHTAALGQQNPYRLKEPDQKKACLACHADFDQKLKKRFVHTPVRTGECSGCHDPHVSSHAKLLSGSTRQICAGCHGSMVPANAKSTHKVVVDGQPVVYGRFRTRAENEPGDYHYIAAQTSRAEIAVRAVSPDDDGAIVEAKKSIPVKDGIWIVVTRVRDIDGAPQLQIEFSYEGPVTSWGEGDAP